MRLILTFLAATCRVLMTLPALLIGALGGLLSPSAAHPGHNPNWLRDMPMRERLKWMFEPKTEKERQVALTMPEIMLGLALIAIVTAAGIVAYNTAAPRVRSNSIMAGAQGFIVDVASFRSNYFSYNPSGVTGANATSAIGWDHNGVAPTITPSNTQCLAGTNNPFNGCTGAGAGTPTAIANPNFNLFSNLPSLQFADGEYDPDAAAEWHIPIGTTDALEVAFVLAPNPTGNAGAYGDGGTLGGGNTIPAIGDFSRCVGQNPSILMALAVESSSVCEQLAINFARQDMVSNAWCTGLEPAGTNTDGDDTMLMCIAGP